MAKMDVTIKHSGKTHKIALDTDASPVMFKQSISEATGVPIERMKVMIKGGMLKDDTDWKKVNPKPGQQFMVIGTASEIPKPPEKPVVFLEDMDDTELAETLALPGGLENLGNTCYMNATVQVMRVIPELHTAFQGFEAAPDPPSTLTGALKTLYENMSKTSESYTPHAFLQVLRQVVPQFNELARNNSSGFKFQQAYAQQDADECYTALVGALRSLPGLPGPDGSSALRTTKFVEQYMMGEMTQELKCDDAPDEPATISKEKIMKIECNISSSTNYLMSGIKDSLDEKIEKMSPTLQRTATYTKHSRISRLPNNLAVHMVRFYWRRDINKKAKIMRRVKFPFELDVLELCTDDLKAKLLPLNTKLKEVDRDRRERTKIRKKTKKISDALHSAVMDTIDTAAATEQVTALRIPDDIRMEMQEGGSGVDKLEDESVIRQRERAEIDQLINEELRKDTGASVSGLYDLCGIVTHKGAGADSGHYIGYVKKNALTPSPTIEDEVDESWYKFDDAKVSVIKQEQIVTLEGGGEDSVAYILLYRGRSLS